MRGLSACRPVNPVEIDLRIGLQREQLSRVVREDPLMKLGGKLWKRSDRVVPIEMWPIGTVEQRLLCVHLLEQGHQVLAGVRDMSRCAELVDLVQKGNLQIHLLDVTNDASVASFAEWVMSTTSSIDVLMNNAGIMDERAHHLEDVDIEYSRIVFDVNVLGPLRLTKALLPALKEGGAAKIGNLSSLMGSIADNRSGGYYAYRASKTSLNMITMSMSRDLEDEGITPVALHPGWVRTDMGGPNGAIDVKTSTHGLFAVMEGLGISDGGSFIQWDGTRLPW